jgi:hypothetical protein
MDIILNSVIYKDTVIKKNLLADEKFVIDSENTEIYYGTNSKTNGYHFLDMQNNTFIKCPKGQNLIQIQQDSVKMNVKVKKWVID